MLADFIDRHSSFRDTFTQASEVLGYDLLNIVLDGPESELNRTEITQPALLTSGVASWRLWCGENGSMPGFMAGHSLGEYTALVCAGAIGFEDAVTLVRDRGIYMQSAVARGEGAMAAIIGLPGDKVEKACASTSVDGTVSAANFNSPEQTVIAGHAGAVRQAMELALGYGAKRAILLPVSVPSHCSLMKPAADQLSERLEGIEIMNARIPVVQNVDARPHTKSDEIKAALIQQLHRPVLWVDTVNRLVELGCGMIIESGPGRVLSGLIKRINRDIDVLSLNTLDSFQSIINGASHDN
jgi:[acyl-carrier-protein] S-malonyltransferase